MKKQGARRDEILRAARGQFAHDGYTGTSRRRAATRRRVRRAVAAWLLALIACAGFAGALPASAVDPPATATTTTERLTPAASQETVVAIPGSREPLRLEVCIAEALESNAALAAERSGRGELKGQMIQARAIGLPTLDATGNWSRGRDPSFALNEMFRGWGDESDSTGGEASPDSLPAEMGFLPDLEDMPVQTFWRTSLNAHWELNPGLVYNAVGAAGLGIERQELLITDAEHRTEEAAMDAYYAVIMAGEELAALDAELAARREFLEVTRRRFFLGFSTPLDTLRAAVSLANLAPLRRSAAQRLRDAGSALNVLMGRRTLAPVAVDSRVTIERDTIDPDLAAARVDRRPDIRSVELYEAMMRKNRGAQKAGNRPSFSADASYGYVTSDLADLFDAGHDFWSTSVSIKLPLFDGFSTRGKVEEVEASIDRIAHERDEALRQARLEVLSILGELEAARENLEAARLNLAAAESALEQMTLRYELGKADYLSVLNVQSNRFVARTNHINARKEVLTLTASIKRALGFSPSMPLATVVGALRAQE